MRRIPGFTLQALVCPLGSGCWKPAYQVIDLSEYFKPVRDTSCSAYAGQQAYSFSYEKAKRRLLRTFIRIFLPILPLLVFGAWLFFPYQIHQGWRQSAACLRALPQQSRLAADRLDRCAERIRLPLERMGSYLINKLPSPR